MPWRCGQGVWPALSLSKAALCVLQHPSSLPADIHIQLILTWSLELFETSWEKTEALYCLSSAQWRHLASVRSLVCSGCLAVSGIPSLAQSSWDHVTGKGQSTSACVHGQSLLILCFAWRTLLALGICCCSIFVLITGVKGNQGLVFCWIFLCVFLIGEIQIKCNKWTPDVGYILESLRKGKRPQRGWTWFLGTLYMTQGEGSKHLRFVKPKSDNTGNDCYWQDFHLCFGEPNVFVFFLTPICPDLPCHRVTEVIAAYRRWIFLLP